MKYLLKASNPFIWLLNFFNYCAHFETYRHFKKYEPYDFSRDIKYF